MTWYRDRVEGHRFGLVAVQAETVDVVDEWGIRRRVNRMLWDRDMEEDPRDAV